MSKAGSFFPNLLRCLKIRRRITVFLASALMLCSLIILAVSVLSSHFLIDGYIFDYVESSQQQISTSTESRINEIIMVSVRIKTNQDIYNLIEDKSLDFLDRESRLQILMDSLLSDSDKESIGNIYIIDTDNNAYEYEQNNTHISKPDSELINSIKGTDFSVCGKTVRDQDNVEYIPFGMAFRNFYTEQSMGYLVIYIREDSIYNIYKEIVPEWGYSFILSGNDYIMSHADKDKIGTTVKDAKSFSGAPSVQSANYNGQKSVIAVHKLSYSVSTVGFDWRIVSVIPYAKLFQALGQIENWLFIIGIGMLFIAMMLSMMISKRITVPLQKLKDTINALGAGKLDSMVESHINDELWELEKSYNDMVLRISDLIRKNDEEKEKKREMELIALQAQINPHFLYNTLDAIGWIARLKKQDDIECLVMELAKFFRLSLHKGDKLITIDDEIQLVQSFVTIEQMRAPGKFEIEYHIPDEIKDILMPKIILQPIVENAIKHGVGEKHGKGHITVNGYRFDDNILLEVVDDGIGFDVHKKEIKSKTSIQHSGYGLKNVDERIKLEYGDCCGIRIQSEIGVGTRVQVRFYIKIEQGAAK